MTLKTSTFALTLSAAALTAVPAFAVTNLVKNGDFTSNTGSNGQIGFNITADPWTTTLPTTSYWFIWYPGSGTSGTTADTTGAVGHYGTVKLWGPGTGVSNGLMLSPDGGPFAGADAAFQNAPLKQTINGLIPGHTYTLSFDWAVAEQAGHGSPGVDIASGWDVSLGTTTDTTGTISIPFQGFSGWQKASFSVTATSASETLSFLAIGFDDTAPVPPFALLDSVSITQQVPEPSTWAMMAVGFAGLGYAGFRSQRRKPAAIG